MSGGTGMMGEKDARVRKRLDDPELKARIADIKDDMKHGRGGGSVIAEELPAFLRAKHTGGTGEVSEQEPEMEPLWAHVVLDPGSHAPALMSDEELAEVNEAMRDCTRGFFIDRAWIQAGPLSHPLEVQEK